MVGNILKSIGYIIALIVACFMVVTFFVWIVGFLLLIAVYFLTVHLLGTPITIKRGDVVIGRVKWFKYYPVRY